VATPVRAQLYDDTRRVLGLAPDPLARSPRLVGMGGLSLIYDDAHSRMDLWEYAHNPAALLNVDSTSTFELYPATESRSEVHDDASTGTTRERQDFALREVRFGYEAWRRASSQTAFGFIGELGRLRTDVPATTSSEERQQFTVPNTVVAIAGRV